jgi:hypothetical protein
MRKKRGIARSIRKKKPENIESMSEKQEIKNSISYTYKIKIAIEEATPSQNIGAVRNLQARMLKIKAGIASKKTATKNPIDFFFYLV